MVQPDLNVFRDRLDTEVKSQRCRSACLYSCSAVAYNF